MPIPMHADTGAIHALGHTDTALSAELARAAALVASVPTAASPATFGPVGADFVAALADAAARVSAAVAALGGGVGAAGRTAQASAVGYREAEQRAADRLTVP